MICENCLLFLGLGIECLEDHYVDDGLEAANCEDYLFNGGCDSE